MPKMIQKSFLKRARMPHFYNTGFQMIQFWDAFSKKSLKREGFQESKTDKKQMSCQKIQYLKLHPTNYYVFHQNHLKIASFESMKGNLCIVYHGFGLFGMFRVYNC